MPQSPDESPAPADLLRRIAELEAENARLAGAARKAGHDQAAMLRLAQEAGGICSWQWDVSTNALHWSESCQALHGMAPFEPPSFERWIGGVHPDDRPAVEAALQGTLAGGSDGWDIEFRYTRYDDGAERWLVGRGRVERDAADGRPLRMIGIGFDITERKDSEARQALLMRELDHRARNLLAVVQAALRLTPKDDPVEYARAVEGRINALARAHGMLAEARWSGSDLRALIAAELAPFLAAQRVALDGPPVMLPAHIAQPLAMAIHELATNAVKHGALAAGAGHIAIGWHLSGGAGGPPRLALRWAEAGGPPVTPPSRRGFGSRMLEATVRGQLGGGLALDWAAEGLRCALELPLDRRSEQSGF
ncbi:sensor histidine kinase [Roseomonas sp. AR75]|uniref:sensor histidine kinase n=1 Tax=Roseomonas sp. AR75 TaxID=2562311 RepID=UPI0010BFF996|nr:sensor histidine kinase [Roseomonas sp. AR75]